MAGLTGSLGIGLGEIEGKMDGIHKGFEALGTEA